MMTVFHLVHLQLDNQYSFFKSTKKWKWLLPVIFVCFSLFTLKTFIDYFMVSFINLGISINQSLLTILLSFLAVLSLVLSLSKIVSSLYLSKDNELLMSFPATHDQVFFSKIISIYIHEVIVNAMFSFPILMWFKSAAMLGVSYTFFMTIYLLIIPMFIIIIAALLSIPLMIVIRFLKKHFVLAIIVIVTLAALVIGTYIYGLTRLSFTVNFVDYQITEIVKFNSWCSKTAKSLGLFSELSSFIYGIRSGIIFLELLGVIVVGGAISLFITKAFFFRLAMSMAEGGGQARISIVRDYKVSSPMRSLLHKEALTIMRNPNYVFQYFLFTLLMPFVVVSYNYLLKDVTITQVGASMVFAAHVLIMAIFTFLSNLLSANLISLEGGTFYIMKTSPVSYHVQIMTKVLFNFIATMIAVILTSIAVIIFLGMNPLYVVLSSIAILIAALGNICLNIELDLRKPALSWYDSNEITSISKTMTKAILYAFLLGLIIGAIMFLIIGNGNSFVPFIILIILMIPFALFRIYCLYFRTIIFFGRTEI